MVKPTRPAGCFLQTIGGILVVAGIYLIATKQSIPGGGIALLCGLGLMLLGRLGLRE